MSTIFTQGRFSAEDAAGAPLVGGLLHTYSSGTTTPKATYSDPGLTAANTNPIALDARGEAQIWLGSGAYSMRLTDAAGVTIWTVDGITPSSAPADALAAALQTDANGSGADLVAGTIRTVSTIAALRAVGSAGRSRVMVAGYYAAGDGGGGLYWLDTSDTTTADNGGTVIVSSAGGRWKLAATGVVSVKQFGARGNDSADDTAAINAALANVYGLYFPEGVYRISSALTFTAQNLTRWAGRKIRGAGLGDANSGTSGTHGSVIRITGTNDAFYCTDTLPYFTIEDLSIIGGSTSGRGIYCTGTCAETEINNVGIYTGKQAIYMPSVGATYGNAFSINLRGVQASSYTTSAIELAGGPGTNLFGCYAHNFPTTAGTAGFRIYKEANFYGCNSVDAGGTALLAGQWVAAGDAQNTEYHINVFGGNFEAFSKAGIELRYQGVANITGATFYGSGAYDASIIQNGIGASQLPIIVDRCVFTNSTAYFMPISGAWWQGSWYYPRGARVQSGANLYECTQAGTSSASTNPTGTGSAISEGGCVWKYIGPAASTRTKRSELYTASGGQANFVVRDCPSLGVEPLVDFGGTAMYVAGGDYTIYNTNGRDIARQMSGPVLTGPLILNGPLREPTGVYGDYVAIGNQIATNGATAGAAQALPSAPAGYLLAWINGAQRRIPYY